MQQRKRKRLSPARDSQMTLASLGPATLDHTAPPCARSSSTSRAAARRIRQDSGRLGRLVLEAIRHAGQDGLIDAEIEAVTGLGGNTARPRRVGLVQAGRVVNSGRRRPTVSGRLATVWICPEFAGIEEAAA